MSDYGVSVKIARLGVPLLLLVMAGSAWAGASEADLQEVYVVQNSEFTGQFPTGFVRSLDLSPDGKMLAVEFEVWEGEGLAGIWITLWDVDKQCLQTAKRLEGPDTEVGNYPQYGYRVQFTLDGHLLLVLTGPRLVALSLPDLEVSYAIEAPAHEDPGAMFIYKFSVAAGTNRVALLYVPHRVFGTSFDVQVADLENGKLGERWHGAGQASNIALSPDGATVAVPIVSGLARSGENKCLLFDARSGERIRTITTLYATGDVLFLDEGTQLLTIPQYHEAPEYYPTDTVKVWNVSSGELLSEFGYGKEGMRGVVSASRDGTRLAATTTWSNPSDIRWDRDNIRGFTRFLLWETTSRKQLFVSSDLSGQMQPYVGESSDFLIRLSADGTRLAVGGELISVYSIASK
ncbi:MAG: WD40 repeat domain-containing protein [Dehalococcoidia bacterium]